MDNIGQDGKSPKRVTVKKDFKTGEVTEEERIEETQVKQKGLIANKGSQPLVKGFRNKTVIFPLALLQKRIENYEKSVTTSFTNFQQQVSREIQQSFQYSGTIKKDLNDLQIASEALATILGVTEEKLDAKVKKIKAERLIVREKEQDEAQGLKVVNRAAKKGDVVKIDFVGSIDGKEFNGGTATGHQLKLGNDQFIPGFEDQLIGVRPGDSVDVKVSFPVDYGNKGLAGKSAVFKTTVIKVKESTVKEEKKDTESKAEKKDKK